VSSLAVGLTALALAGAVVYLVIAIYRLFVVVCGRQLDIAVVRKKSAQEREVEEKLAVERRNHALALESSRLKSAFLANMGHGRAHRRTNGLDRRVADAGPKPP